MHLTRLKSFVNKLIFYLWKMENENGRNFLIKHMSSKNKLEYDMHTLYKVWNNTSPPKNVLYLHPAVCNQNKLRRFQNKTFLDNIQSIALRTITGYELEEFENIISKKDVELFDVYVKKNLFISGIVINATCIIMSKFIPAKVIVCGIWISKSKNLSPKISSAQ